MIRIFAKCTIRKDAVDDFKTAAYKLVELSRQEKGCIEINLHQDNEDKKLFFFFEVWKDQETIDEHNSHEYVQELGPIIHAAFEKETEVHYVTLCK